ncbi:MAG: CBS domain-containing protein [Alphaproteobacteria bacterium]|nr:CBS domain-containing protein [Alphaproteobacteria bacterium]
MDVAQILAQKGRSVVTAALGQTLQDIATVLADKKIGAIVVVDAKGAIAGIVSERDVVRAIARHGAAALKKPASDVMTAKVRTCAPHDTEAELMGLMTTHRIRHLPVVDNGKLSGMVSIGDVVKLRIESVEREAEDLKSYIATAG